MSLISKWFGTGSPGETAEENRYAALGEELLEEFGVSRREIVPSRMAVGFTGFTFSNELLIGGPWPTLTPSELFVLAHEIGHVRLHVRRNADGWYRLKDAPSYVLEYEAEQFAIDWLERHGVRVPAEDLAGARANVARHLREAQEQCAVEIDREIAAWAGVTTGGSARDDTAAPLATMPLSSSPHEGPQQRCELGVKRVPLNLARPRSSLAHLVVALIVFGLLALIIVRLSE